MRRVMSSYVMSFQLTTLCRWVNQTENIVEYVVLSVACWQKLEGLRVVHLSLFLVDLQRRSVQVRSTASKNPSYQEVANNDDQNTTGGI